MTPEQFTYWLQGYAELNATPPSAEQWQSIRDHLATVFNKVTPNRWAAPGMIGPGILSPASPQWGAPYKVECSAGGIHKRNGDHAMTTC
jgi:hypothetical protein